VRVLVSPVPLLGALAALGLATPAEASLKAELHDSIEEHQSMLDRCYDRELKRAHPATGTVMIELVVGRSGKVRSAKVAHATRAQSKVSKCLAQKLKQMKLPKQGARATVQVPIRLRTS
jgi:hypothetical protein